MSQALIRATSARGLSLRGRVMLHISSYHGTRMKESCTTWQVTNINHVTHIKVRVPGSEKKRAVDVIHMCDMTHSYV